MYKISSSLIFLVLLSSCRLDTEALTTVDTLARNIPNIVIKKVVYKEIEENLLTQEVYADEFQIFSQDDLVQVLQGQVKTYRNGKEELEGEAASAQFNQETEDANVLGPIEIYYHPEKTRIRAQELDWISKERRLTSIPEGLVEVEQNNGTKFQGRDFSIDMRDKTVAYRKEVKGELYTTGEEENAVLEEDSETEENVDAADVSKNEAAGELHSKKQSPQTPDSLSEVR